MESLELFCATTSSQQLINSNISRPDVTKEKVIYAIKSAKSGKTVGPDDIPGDILMLLVEENIQIIVRLFNGVYKTEMIPSDWVFSTLVTLPKSYSVKKCGEYRTMSLMSHVLKIFLKVIHNRMYRK
ncbi:unnamed protein product [Euphydryas editha]|uniref:Reverse transcriptase n=1 Tax=Euphydryas editha TaxID=104508 RepID=A0AAU9UKH3_EUPED|nr:unnamed protein product [Euphydryas editha]